jgi:UDP-2,4-diacetamido-2,4,6-trideoxy-beta-L-altropyranose hydrolase
VNVFIVTEGGKNIGFGHITRCASIYQVLEEIGIHPRLIVNGDETVEEQLKEKNCDIFDWLGDPKKLFVVLKSADIVFVDSYLADYKRYENISKTARLAVYFDDEIRIDYPKGIVVNGAIFAERMPYPERNNIKYLLGAQYAPLGRNFWEVPKKPINAVLGTVMITFGGADVCNLTPKVLRRLADTYPELNKKVIIGKSFKNIAQIEKVKDDNTELVYYPDRKSVV